MRCNTTKRNYKLQCAQAGVPCRLTNPRFAPGTGSARRAVDEWGVVHIQLRPEEATSCALYGEVKASTNRPRQVFSESMHSWSIAGVATVAVSLLTKAGRLPYQWEIRNITVSGGFAACWQLNLDHYKFLCIRFFTCTTYGFNCKRGHREKGRFATLSLLLYCFSVVFILTWIYIVLYGASSSFAG